MDQIEKLHAKTAIAVGEGDWKSVESLSKQILSLDSQNPSALTFLKMAKERLAEKDESAEIAEEKVELLPASFVGNRYTVKELIGEGARKKVYLCHDSTLDRDIAFSLVKTDGLDKDARERVMREARLMGRLVAHPQIVSVFDLGEEDGKPFIVTEYMGGGDIDSLIEDAPGNRIPLDKTLEIAKSVRRGLEFAHSQGIVHRDLKPGNVWLTSRGENPRSAT